MKTPMNLPQSVCSVLGGWPTHVAALAEETTNWLWRLERGQKAWVWRQFAPAPGVDRAREAAFMQCGSGCHWMPPVQVWHPQGMLMPWLEGQHISRLNPSQRKALVAFCLVLWAQPSQALPQWDYADLVNRYAKLAGSKYDNLAKGLMQAVAQWPRAQPCWVHHDLHAGNLLWHGAHCWVLDWEFAGLGNPWLDAISLDRWVHLQPQEWAQLAPVLAPWSWRGALAYADWLEGLDTLWSAARRQLDSAKGRVHERRIRPR